MSNLTFSEFDESRLDEQRRLFCLSFPETLDNSIETKEHYQWKFKKYPAAKPSYQYIAEANNKMLGYYASIPYKYKVGTQNFTCGMVCDVMTHPDARGKGVFTKIGHFSTDAMKASGLDFVSGYPIRPEVIPGHLKVGWTIGFELPMFICFLRSNDFLKTKGLGLLAPLVNLPLKALNSAIDFVNKLRFSKKTAPYEVITESLEQFLENDKALEFVTNWTESNTFCLVKNKEFIAWRFSAPNTKYHFLQIKSDNQIMAIAIVRCVNLKGINSLAVLDIMVDNDNFHYHHALVSELKNLARQLKQDVIAGVTTDHWHKKYSLSRYLFIKSPFVFKFIYKIFNPKLTETDFGKDKNWHLMWIDSDDL